MCRNTPHAKTLISGCLSELLSSEKRGVDAFLRRDLAQAEENGVFWSGSRMMIRNQNMRQWVPVVDTSRVQWHSYSRKIPIVYKVPFCTMLKLTNDANATVSLRLENSNNSRCITLKGSRARTLSHRTSLHDTVAKARWRVYMTYIEDCVADFTDRHFDELINRAPSRKERQCWIVQKQLIRSGLNARAARIRNWTQMKRAHGVQ